MKARHWVPLISFIVPTVVIGYGFVFPRNGISSNRELTIGFAITLFSACLTYTAGIRTVLRDRGKAQ
jgi:ABC-type Fe3+ transport system permease subunit